MDEEISHGSVAVLIRDDPRSKEVSIQGAVYPSLSQAAVQLGLPKGTVHTRITSENHKYKDWFYIE